MAKSRRGQDTRENILLAAAESFAEKGFRGTTVRAICHKANANLAAIKYHFGSKEELYIATFQYLFSEQDIRAVNSISLDIGNREEWCEQVYHWVHLFLSRVTGSKPQDIWRSQLFLWERVNPSAVFPVIMKDFLMPFRSKLDQLLRLGLPEGTSEDEAFIWNVSVFAQCTAFCTRAPLWRDFLFPPSLSYADWLESASRHVAGSITDRLEFRGASALETDSESRP